jgi:hypothetical protein
LNDILRLAPTHIRVHSVDFDACLHRLELVLVHGLVPGPDRDSSTWVEMPFVRIQTLVRVRQEVIILLNETILRLRKGVKPLPHHLVLSIIM